MPIKNGVIEIKYDQKLLNRLIMLCRSRQDIDMKECIGKYELSVVPRSLFASREKQANPSFRKEHGRQG